MSIERSFVTLQQSPVSVLPYKLALKPSNSRTKTAAGPELAGTSAGGRNHDDRSVRNQDTTTVDDTGN